MSGIRSSLLRGERGPGPGSAALQGLFTRLRLDLSTFPSHHQCSHLPAPGHFSGQVTSLWPWMLQNAPFLIFSAPWPPCQSLTSFLIVLLLFPVWGRQAASCGLPVPGPIYAFWLSSSNRKHWHDVESEGKGAARGLLSLPLYLRRDLWQHLSLPGGPSPRWTGPLWFQLPWASGVFLPRNGSCFLLCGAPQLFRHSCSQFPA